MAKEKTVLKPIRINENVVKEIEQEAIDTNTNFSQIANYRLRHHDRTLTPAITATIQDIVNTAEELVGIFAPKEMATLQKKVEKLWMYLK